MSSDTPRDESGATIGRYTLLRKIGEGGMGEVYAATDLQLGRTVALKLLPPDVAGDPERRHRFQREAKAVAALNHPNIIVLHSVEEAEGRMFLTMELVQGEVLSRLIPRGGLAPDAFFRWAIPLVEAIGAAHLKGVTHRDLKPHNVMVGDDGRLKVLDFGLAQMEQAADSMAQTATMTAQGKIAGTVAYMSPEQAQGRRLDHRTDVFSLGVVLFEMATGELPFNGDSTIAILSGILRDPAPLVTELNPAMPRRLASVVRRCLEKAPDRRYQSTLDLRNDLEEARDDLAAGEVEPPVAEVPSPLAGPAPAPARAPAPAPAPAPRRNWRALALAAAVVGSFVAGGTLGTRLRPPASAALPGSIAPAPPPPAAPVITALAQLTGEDGAELQPSLSPDGTWFVYASHSSGNWDVYRQRVGGEKPMSLTADTKEDDAHPAISPDGERIAFRSSRSGGGIFVMGATGESVKRLTDFGSYPSWLPDGKSLIVSTESTDDPRMRNNSGVSEAWVVEVATGAKRQLPHGDMIQAVVSPGGHRVAYWGMHKGGVRDVWTAPLGEGAPVQLTDDIAVDWGPVWSPDGHHVYFSSDRDGSPNLFRVPIDERSGRPEGPIERVTTSAGEWTYAPSFSRDGRRAIFVVGGPRDRVEKIAFDAAKEATVGPPIRLARGDYPWVGDGWVAFHTLAPHDDLAIVRDDGSGMRRLTEDGPRDRAARFSPDGKRIAFQSDRGGSYDIWSVRADGSDLQQLTAAGNLLCPVWSPDAKQMSVFRMGVGTMLFDPGRPWRDQTPKPLAPFPLKDLTFFGYDWSPDGRLLGGVALTSTGAYAGVWVHSFASGDYRQVAKSGEEPVVFLSDSRRVLYVDHDEIVLADSQTGKGHTVLSLVPDILRSGVSVARDDRWLYYSRRSVEGDVWMATLK